MALEKTNPTGSVAWNKLREHFEQICYTPMQEFFAHDKNRAERFHIEWDDFLVDYSKNKISLKTIDLFIDLAEELGLTKGIQSLFSGDKINVTENRAVLHTALRANRDTSIYVDGKDVVPEIFEVKEKIKSFSESVISGNRKGYTSKPFTDVINIGIGGSDLGPAMVTEALKFYKNHLNIHYLSNIDGDGFYETIKNINPETTLFVIVSKTFTTQETITNAQAIREWFLQHATKSDIAKHFVAVSSNVQKVQDFGISEDNIFPMWDWIGGRFSLWSAVGISTVLGIGYDNFERLLEGANRLDNHFATADFRENIPVVLAFLSVWYNNFFELETHCVVPYSDSLKKLIPYLQQLVMESNGKNISREGDPVNTQTGNVIFGEVGTNSQHAFFQLLHQGTKLIPADFIGFIEPLNNDQERHHKLMSHFFAQTEALLNGKENEGNLYREFYGDKPTNTILIRKLTPENLGALLAIYEHKTFVEGFLWNIFSFDQFGVELGKELAVNILNEIQAKRFNNHDSSTNLLLKAYLKGL